MYEYSNSILTTSWTIYTDLLSYIHNIAMRKKFIKNANPSLKYGVSEIRYNS